MSTSFNGKKKNPWTYREVFQGKLSTIVIVDHSRFDDETLKVVNQKINYHIGIYDNRFELNALQFPADRSSAFVAFIC